MARQKRSKIISVITWLLLLLLLVGGIGAICHFAGIGKDDITDIVNPTFRVEYAGKVYKADTENVIVLPKSGQARFEIKNCENCAVKVLPNVNAETDFIFTVDGQEHKYSEVQDLTAVFIKANNVYGDYFVIDCNNDFSLESVLSMLYDIEQITISEHVNIPPYKIVVTSSNGQVIELQFPYIESTGLKLSSGSIVF